MRPPLRQDFSDSGLAEHLSFIENLQKSYQKTEKIKRPGGASPVGPRLENM
jgi:hypothetical protein